MSEFNLKQHILSDITGIEYLNRKVCMEQPVLNWQNNITQLNATNLNRMSRSISNVQQQFSIEAHNLQYLLGESVKNSAGWLSTENESGTAEIFNDYENNQAVADYSHAEGLMTRAGHGYSSIDDGHIIYSGIASHTQGEGTVAVGDYQFVHGRWNVLDAETHPINSGELIPTNESAEVKGTYAHIIGAGTDNDNRKNIYTLDWHGSGWFANAITADGNVTFGTNGNNRHRFKGKTWFEHAVKIDSNLGVYGNVKLGTDNKNTVTINSATILNSTLQVEGITQLNGNLNVVTNATISGKTTSNTLEITDISVLKGLLEVDATTDFKNNVTFSGADKKVIINPTLTVNGKAHFNEADANKFTTEELNATGKTSLKDTEIDGNIDVSGHIQVVGKLTSNTDVEVSIGEGNAANTVTLMDEHNHLDYQNLIVKDKDERTVPNAIAFTEDKLIGRLTLNTENLGEITAPTLTNESIYGVAQYSINLVKNLLTAYILDNDSDDPEARSAIDKLIEVADWIKDDSAGAGKIISDVDKLSKNKLDSSTYNTFKVNNYDVLSKLVSDNKPNWDTAYNAMHNHSNLTQLENITSAKITNWNDAFESSHSHDNKALIDSITSDRMQKWDASSALLEGVSQDAIDGVIADGLRITENTNRLNVIDETIESINSNIDNIDVEIVNIKNSIGSNNTNNTIMGRLKALEDRLNTLITYGTDDPADNTNTQYYVKYEQR